MSTRHPTRRSTPRVPTRHAVGRAAGLTCDRLEARLLFSNYYLVNASTTTDYGDQPSYVNPPSPYVPAVGYSLRNALTLAAYHSAQGDYTEISLTAGQTYRFTANPQPSLKDTAPAAATPVVGGTGFVFINGHGATIDLSQAPGQELLTASGSANIILQNVTVQGGFNLLGGALSIYGAATLSATNVTFSNNRAGGTQAGAALNGGGYAGATAEGGAIYLGSSGTSYFTNDTFTNNVANGGAGISGGNYGAQGGAGQGGAILIASLASGTQSVQFTNTAFVANTAVGGGSADNGDGLGPIAANSATSYQDLDYAQGQGGAVYVGKNANVTFANTTLNNNLAVGHKGDEGWDDHNGEDGGLGQGGAIYAYRSTVTLTGGSVTTNHAVGGGGGNEDDNSQGGKGGDGQGGAFYTYGATLNLNDTATTGNAAYGGLTGDTDGDGVHQGNGHGSSPVIYTTGTLDYGAAQGGAVYAYGASTVAVAGGSVQGNTAQGRSGLSYFYDGNGEDGGNAEGGAFYLNLTTGSVTLNGAVSVAGNQALGGGGGGSGGGNQDKSGSGGNGRGGAAYVAAGTLAITDATLSRNAASAGANGNGKYGVEQIESAPRVPSVPTLDVNRSGFAQGGAVYLAAGALSVSSAVVQSNVATAANAGVYQNINAQSGRNGGTAQGGAFYLANPSSAVSVVNSQVIANGANGGTGGTAGYGSGIPVLASQPLGGYGGSAGGGGVYLATGTLNLTGDLFAQNGAYGGQGGTATTGFAGGNGTGSGGAITSAATVNLTSTIVEQNFAWGGPRASLAGVAGGGNGQYGGGSGGAGGNAYGGGLDLTGGSLTAANAVLQLNQAFGGNGGAGFDGTNVGTSGGVPAGNGGSGGNAYGGGIYATTGVAVTLTQSAFRENLVLGGLGGRGGNGGGNTDYGSNGGIGGNGGSGGSAFGGGIAAFDPSLQYARPNIDPVSIATTRFVENQAGGGDGGEGGNSGFGGSGQTDGGSSSGTYHGGSGGTAGNGGNAGPAEGGAVWDAGAAMTIVTSAFAQNGVTGGWGGDGGIGGPGGNGKDNGYALVGHRDSYGGYGGTGGNGGGGGTAQGGAIGVDAGTLALQSSSVLTDTATAGFGGDGGQGGEAGQGVQDDDGGTGGIGGIGGGGGYALGGGVYVGSFYFYGIVPATGRYGAAPAAASVTATNDTVSANAVNAGGGGLGGAAGPKFGDLYTTDATTRASLTHGDAVQGIGYAAGGSAVVSAILSSPTTFLKGLTKYGQLVKQRSGSSPRQVNLTNDQASDDARASADAQKGGNSDLADLEANTQSDLLDNEEGLADAVLDGTYFNLDDEGADVVASGLGDALSGLGGEVSGFGAEVTAGTPSAVEAAAGGFGDVAGTLAEAVAGVGESLAETVPDVIIATVTGLAASTLGPEAVISAIPAGIVGVYFGVAGAAAGIAALVAEIQGGNASDAAEKILGIFFQPGQYDGSGYNLGALFQGEKNTDVENGVAGPAGNAGGAGTALGGGLYTGGPVFTGTALASPTVALQNTIVAGNSATARKYVLNYYSNSPGSTFGDITITNNNGYAEFPDYPVLTGISRPDAADADLASAMAGAVTSGGGNVVGVAGSLAGSASDQTGTATSPFNPGLTPVQFDEINSPVILAEVGNASTIARGTFNNLPSTLPATDQLGDSRFTVTGNIFTGGSITLDAGAVEYNGSPVVSLGGDQELLTTTLPKSVAGFATLLAASPLAAAAGQPVSYLVTDDSNPGLFAASPVIQPDGTLTYTLAAGALGTAVITVHAAQASVTGQPLTFAIRSDGSATVVVNSDQPAGTVAANSTVHYTVYSSLPAGEPALAAGDTVQLLLTLPAGFTVTGFNGQGWRLGRTDPSTMTVTATFTATGPVAADTLLPGLVVTGTFAAATYAPVLTAAEGFVVPNALNTDSNLVFTNAAPGAFTVGSPVYFRLTPNESATLAEASADSLPAGLTFDPSTGLLSGTPVLGSGGTYVLNVTADALVGQSYTQAFAITVDEPLTVQTGGSTTFTAGRSGSYTVTTVAYPLLSTFTLQPANGGSLPAGLTTIRSQFGDRTTITIAGTPAAGTAGTYVLNLTLVLSGGLTMVQSVPLTVLAPLPSYLDPASLATYDPATNTVTVTGPTTIIADPGSAAPTVVASGSAAALSVNTLSGSQVHLARLTLTGGATATLNNPATRPVVLDVAGNGLTVDATSKLNLGRSDLDVAGGNLAALTALLARGYNGGLWNGTGITSSAAAADTARLTAVGILLNNANGSTPIRTTFDGNPAPAATDVLLKYTYYGDANLDGAVSGQDYARIDAGFLIKGALTGWFNGDFNYDGKVDASDYTLVDNGFNTQRASLAFSPQVVVAAPAAFVVLAPAAAHPTARPRTAEANPPSTTAPVVVSTPALATADRDKKEGLADQIDDLVSRAD